MWRKFFEIICCGCRISRIKFFSLSFGMNGCLEGVFMKAHESEEISVKEIVAGDKRAFERLFQRWYAPLCMYAESVVKDRDVAEDLVQGMFCQLWEKREGLNIRESLQAYLYRSVYHAALNSLKHDRVRLAFCEFEQRYGEQGENDVERFMDRKDREMLSREIHKAIDTLPEQCREIFLMSRFAGKKSQEIADKLGISLRTVETQLYRAMKQLRGKLAHLRGTALLWVFVLRGKTVR